MLLLLLFLRSSRRRSALKRWTPLKHANERTSSCCLSSSSGGALIYENDVDETRSELNAELIAADTSLSTIRTMRVSSTSDVGCWMRMASPTVSSSRNLVPIWPMSVVPDDRIRPLPFTLTSSNAGSLWASLAAPSSRSRLCFLLFLWLFLGLCHHQPAASVHLLMTSKRTRPGEQHAVATVHAAAWTPRLDAHSYTYFSESPPLSCSLPPTVLPYSDMLLPS